MRKWNWLWNSFGKWPKTSRRARRASPAVQRSRSLSLEPLEDRRLLSVDATIAALLAKMTPDPHPTGDQPSDTSRMITLTAYSPQPIFDPGIAELEPLIDGERLIFRQHLEQPTGPALVLGRGCGCRG